jgi:hypothetical protein
MRASTSSPPVALERTEREGVVGVRTAVVSDEDARSCHTPPIGTGGQGDIRTRSPTASEISRSSMDDPPTYRSDQSKATRSGPGAPRCA